MVRGQHGAISRAQLLGLGFTAKAVEHRLVCGRLRPIHRGVYVVGQLPASERTVQWAALLATGSGAVFSHRSAAALLGLIGAPARCHLTVPRALSARNPDLDITRALLPAADLTRRHGLPVTSPARTLVDLAATRTPAEIERLIDAADRERVIDPDRLARALDRQAGRRGVARLRRVLEAEAFVVTHSVLERRFVPLAAAAGLGRPESQARLNGHRVDFLWRDLRIVVEVDGLRYHRTSSQQRRDHERDQAHFAAGYLPLRFTYRQVVDDPRLVITTLRKTAATRE